MGSGVPVDIYSTDNGIYTSKDFTIELHVKVQGIRHSGLGGQHHNGVAQNKINNVVRISRNIIVNAALRCPDAKEKRLQTMATDNDVHLHNHIPHISSGMYLEEVWTRSKSSHSALNNSHPWGCNTYVLVPRLQDGNNQLEWMPRSRRSQYLGASPIHA